jgi:hypothetical protein
VKGKGHLEHLGVNVRKILKRALKERGREDMDKIYLAHENGQWRALVKTGRFQKRRGIY